MPFFDTDEDSTNSIYPTDLDQIRINDMIFGDKIESENGNFAVIKYQDGFTLLLNNHPVKDSYLEFKSIKELFMFLKKN